MGFMRSLKSFFGTNTHKADKNPPVHTPLVSKAETQAAKEAFFNSFKRNSNEDLISIGAAKFTPFDKIDNKNGGKPFKLER
jgi:hypothetical protein